MQDQAPWSISSASQPDHCCNSDTSTMLAHKLSSPMAMGIPRSKVCWCVHACACARTCVRACMCAYVCAYVCACPCVYACDLFVYALGIQSAWFRMKYPHVADG